MKYRIALHTSDEGYSVSVPGLPGCWSQGDTEAEALDNIKDAIREYLAVVNEDLKDADIREVEGGQGIAARLLVTSWYLRPYHAPSSHPVAERTRRTFR